MHGDEGTDGFRQELPLVLSSFVSCHQMQDAVTFSEIGSSQAGIVITQISCNRGVWG